MQNSKKIKIDLKTFITVSLATGSFIILFSLGGHVLTPGKLIPSSFVGGAIGLITGTYFCFKQNYIERVILFPVLLCNLFAFDVVSFVIVFNFHHPLLLLFFFLLVGLTTLLSNHYFSNQLNFSKNKFYGIIGLLFSFPALYFIIASLLKFSLGYSFLFSPIETLLSQQNGQANFNSITPFLFGGGLLLSFGLNLFVQLEIKKTGKNILPYKISGWRVSMLNLFVLAVTGFVGLIIISYLAVENLIIHL